MNAPKRDEAWGKDGQGLWVLDLFSWYRIDGIASMTGWHLDRESPPMLTGRDT